MADTLEKRVSDLEQMLAHIPEDLDARFAGVDVKLAEMRETLALHTTRFTKLEARLSDFERKVEARLNDLDRKVDKVDGKLDEVLQRLPKNLLINRHVGQAGAFGGFRPVKSAGGSMPI